LKEVVGIEVELIEVRGDVGFLKLALMIGGNIAFKFD
jgi:hypothetical protein